MSEPQASLRERLLLGLLRVSALLPLSLLRCIGRAIGAGMGGFSSRAKQTTETNLRLCLPELSEVARQQLVRQSLQETACTALEMGPMWFWPAQKTLGLIRHIHNEALYREALADPRGVLVLVPHLGNWELTGLYLSTTATLTALYQPPKQLLLETAILKARSRNGGTYVPTDRRGVSALLKALKAGETVGILPDQEPEPESGVFAPFFGVPALTMTLGCQLLARTRARVIMAVAWRNHAEGGFDLAFEDAGAELHEADPVAAVTAMNAAVERLVRQHPEQYQWEYKRFKKRPDGQPKVY
ncbi:MAG TPA: lysophospholipid acyltransferase family protein [Pseudomonadales bacterium]